MTIREMCERAQATSRAKGFVTEGDIRIDQKLMLTVGELAEAQEELRAGHAPTEVYYNLVDAGRDPSGADGGGHRYVPSDKPEGFLIELADAVIRIGQLAEHVRELYGGMTLAKAIELKMAYNDTRPAMHGGKKF